MSTKVVAFKESSSNILIPPERNFWWAFRPLLLWMRLFGIPLSDIRAGKQAKSSHFLILLIYASAVYIIEMFVLSSSIHRKIQASISSTQNNNQTVASMVNGEVSFYNYMITIMLAHTGLLLVTATRWGGVIKALLQLERSRWFSSQDYQRFRRVFIIGSIFLFLVNIYLFESFFFKLMFHSINLQELAIGMGISLASSSSWIKGIVLTLTHIYPYSGAILFCCCGRVTCLMLRQLKSRIESEMRPGRLNVLSDWKHCYASIGQLIDRLSGSFGFHLLLLISSILIRMTANTFYSLLEVRDSGWDLGNSITSLVMVTKDQVYLVTFTLIGDSRSVRNPTLA